MLQRRLIPMANKMAQNSNEERNVNRVSMRFSFGNGKMYQQP